MLDETATHLGTSMRKLAVSLVLVMGLVWVGAFFFVKNYRDSVAAQMGPIADQLRVPDSWIELSEHIERERFICFNNKLCPTLSRTWQTDRVLSAADIQQLAEEAGWTFEIDGTCQRLDEAVGMSRVCSALGTYEGLQIHLRVDSPDRGAASVLRLNVSASSGSPQSDTD